LTNRKIAPDAIVALKRALTAVYGYKNDLRSFLTTSPGNPHLLARINWSDAKRNLVGILGHIIVAMTSAILLASSSCSLWQHKEEKPEYVFCHANSECALPQICNKDIGYWRPPYTPADAGVCIEAASATCPNGSVLSGGYDPQRGWNTSFCVDGPTYCHSDQECKPPDKCDKHTETFIPTSAGQGAGVCMVGN
jgi:hypothetical protein